MAQLKKKDYKTGKHTGRRKERWVVISEKRAISQAWFRHSKYNWRLYRLSVLCHAVQNSILLCCVDLAHFPPSVWHDANFCLLESICDKLLIITF